MKYSIYCLCLLLVSLCLMGCSKDELTSEEKLCQNITPIVLQYKNNQITYDNLLNNIKSDYDSYCTDDTSHICLSIKSMYSHNEQDLELQDCTKYNENDSLGKSMKNLCESSNNAKKKMIEQKDDVEKAYVNDLERSCDSLTNNQQINK